MKTEKDNTYFLQHIFITTEKKTTKNNNNNKKKNNTKTTKINKTNLIIKTQFTFTKADTSP